MSITDSNSVAIDDSKVVVVVVFLVLVLAIMIMFSILPVFVQPALMRMMTLSMMMTDCDAIMES